MDSGDAPTALWPHLPVEAASIRAYPAAPGCGAAMVVCPGGGYAGHAEHEAEPVARWLNRHGVSAFVLRYRVAPNRHPAPLQDVQRAMRWVRAGARRWALDPERIGVMGFSAGGHLAASAGILPPLPIPSPLGPDPLDPVPCRPAVMVLGYPVISMGRHAHAGSRANLLGPDPSSSLRTSVSLELRVAADTSPAFIWHTADDATVPVQNALLLAQALGRRGRPFALHVYPHGPHGLGLAGGTAAAAWTAECLSFLAEVGFLPAPA